MNALTIQLIEKSLWTLENDNIMNQTNYFRGFIKILRGCLAFYLLYWAVEHFFSTQYFQELHKKLYQNFLFPVLTYLQMDPPQIQIFDGYWIQISQTIGIFQILTAFLYWKYQKIGSIFTCMWGFIGFIMSHFQVIKKSFQLLNYVGFDTINIPIFSFVIIILLSAQIQKIINCVTGSITSFIKSILVTLKIIPKQPQQQQDNLSKFVDKYVQTQQPINTD